MKRLFLMTLLLAIGAVAVAQAPAYFVKADMVRGAEGAMGIPCVPNSVFFNGEKVVFRAIVYDAATGEEMKMEEIQARGLTLTVHLDTVEPWTMFYPPPGVAGQPGPPPGAEYFRGTFVIPADFATGSYGWYITLVDAQGNVADFQPIGAAIGANSVTIQPAN